MKSDDFICMYQRKNYSQLTKKDLGAFGLAGIEGKKNFFFSVMSNNLCHFLKSHLCPLRHLHIFKLSQ